MLKEKLNEHKANMDKITETLGGTRNDIWQDQFIYEIAECLREMLIDKEREQRTMKGVPRTMDDERVWEGLAAGIVEQAAMDYHQARFFLETAAMRSYADETNKNTKINIAKKTLAEVERFFKGNWFKTIMPELDGSKAFEALKHTYETEVRPSKMETFLKTRRQYE